MKTSVALCISLALNLFLASALIKSCNDKPEPCPELRDSTLQRAADTTTHSIYINNPVSISSKANTKTKAKNRVAANPESPVIPFDTTKEDFSDFSTINLCDSIRTYEQVAQDSTVRISIHARVTGTLDSINISWKSKIPDIYSHNYLEPAKANYYIISSVMGGYQSGAGISLMRVKKVAYGIGISTLDGKGYFNVGFGVKINK